MVANWKMNLVKPRDAEILANDFKKASAKLKNIDVVVCPSYVHIPHVFKYTQKESLLLGSQNVARFENASLTGEVSASQLGEYGVKYSIVGHSERRIEGESNQIISEKVSILLKKNITPILCVGESSRDENGQYLHDIEKQLKESLEGVSRKMVEKVVIAYEPLWAIGKNAKRGATKEEIEEVVIAIRRTLSDMYEMKKLPQNKVLYGGSVMNPKDITQSISKGYISGCLVGRASLLSKTFIPLLEEANRLAIQ